MKFFITLLLSLITLNGYSQQKEYLLDFEPGTPSGLASNWLTFDNDPAAAEVVDNPDLDGTNALDSKVLKVVVGPDNAFYAGVNNSWSDKVFGTWKIDMSVASNLTLSMDVHKNYVGTVGIKMGTASQGTSFQITDQNVGNTVVDEWQTLTWDLSGINPNGDLVNISQMVVFVDWTEGKPNRQENSTIYIDNIKFNAEKLTDAPTTSQPIYGNPSDDFEGNGNITWKADANEMNASFDNPAPGGINTSAKVLEYSDEGGTYSNIQFDLSEDHSVTYDLTSKNVFTLKVYVPTPSTPVSEPKILWLKLQDGSKEEISWQGQVVKEQAYEYDVWQELTFDFSSISTSTDRSRLILQFNGENNNEHVKAYIDDLSYGEGDGTVAEPPADPMDDFEGNGNITWKADANVMNASFDNPAPGGINTSAKVLEYSDEGGTYSNIQFDLSTDTSLKYDLSTKNVFTLKVYVPTPSEAVAQSKILWLKLQDGSKGATSWQGQVVKEQAYEYDVWQELTFDFSSISTSTDRSRLIIQFNGENNNEHVKAYIDDLSYGEAATASTIDNALLNISMYPNPASSRLTISAQKTINSAAIYNILGKQVMSLEINKNSESIDVSNLATGMYLIKYSIDNAVGTAKFIKQ